MTVLLQAVAPGLLVALLVVPLTAGAGGESGVYDVLMSLLAAVGALQDAFEAPGHKARLASFGGLTSPPPSSLPIRALLLKRQAD